MSPPAPKTKRRKLQVFVSSTFSDLREERQAAVDAILKAGHIPAGMELFTAGDQSQMRTIQRWIDESDVYMLILGGRYGSIEPSSNISYTELEYDYAVSQRRRIFSVVIDEASLERRLRQRGSDVIEKDNGKALEQFRAKVLSNISSFFSDPKDVKLCVYESLGDLSGDPELIGWVSAADISQSDDLESENKVLKVEIEKLYAQIESSKAAAAPSGGASSQAEIENTLSLIEVKIPAGISDTNEVVTSNLLDVLYEYQASLLMGVQNSAGMSERAKFLFFNVIPKLIVHGLAIIEPISGHSYRRGILNTAGQKILATLDQKKAEAKMRDQNTDSGILEITAPSPA